MQIILAGESLLPHRPQLLGADPLDAQPVLSPHHRHLS